MEMGDAAGLEHNGNKKTGLMAWRIMGMNKRMEPVTLPWRIISGSLSEFPSDWHGISI